MLVVEKTAGLLTHGRPSDRGKDKENLLSLLRASWGGRRNLILPVHRLDRPVSGLLVFARTPKARAALIADFAKKDVERRYLALVKGRMPEDQDRGTFRSWLKTDEPSLRIHSDPEEKGRGRVAVTHYRVLERLKNATFVEVRLETGVRNQIRVHFSEAGFPLLGERMYDDTARNQARFRGQRAGRIFLHAATLGFRHPTTGEQLRFESPLPEDLQGWLSRMRRDGPRTTEETPRSPRPRGGRRGRTATRPS